ncbi:MAG: hypothetical protein HYZ54_14170 [Ignavibacteriae bacterium]|nr:hypothetical protein [Ignavibacteriota bacterium]
MRTNFLSLLLFCLSTFSATAQHEGDNWYFGFKAGMNFQNGIPVPIHDGQITTNEGSAVMSDKATGKLLFYTDGYVIWNGNHDTVDIGLLGGTSGTQTVLIVPNPANSLEYFIITTPDLTGGDPRKITGMYYSLLSVANPACTVIFKNRLLLENVSEKLTGTLDCAETGYWVVTHHISKNIFYSFHVTPQGFEENPIVSPYSERPIDHVQGYMKFSPNGTKIALANSHESSYLALFNFNRLTGSVSDYNLLSDTTDGNFFYGLSFSPDNTKLYSIGRTGFFQYETNLLTPDAIRKSETVFVKTLINEAYRALQLGPDGKIYSIATNRFTLDVINKPNLKGDSCGYKAGAFNLTHNCWWGLPNFMDYVFGDHSFYDDNSNYTGGTATICKGGSIRIGSPPADGFSYSWTPIEGLDNPTISNPIASPTVNTKYRLKISSTDCEGFINYFVTIAEKPKITPVTPICLGTGVELSITGVFPGATYQWFPTTGLDTADKANPIASPMVNTRYKVIVTQGDCTDSAFVNVDLIELSARAGVDKTVCKGESIQIGDTAKTGESYQWTPPDRLDNPTSPNPIASPKITTQYVLEAKKNGCAAYDTVLVTIDNIKPIVSRDTTICKGSSTHLSASGGITYSWSPTIGLDNPNIADPIASPPSTTRYRVLVSNGRCTDSGFVMLSVTPFSGANAGIDKTVSPGATAQLGVSPETDYTYAWQPTTNLNNPNISNPVCSPSSGVTQYILTVTSNRGCVSVDTVLVTVGSIVAKVSNDTVICIGSNLQLMASGGSDYEWSPITGLDNPSIPNPIASPTATTTYNVRVSSGTCKDSTMVTVTVNPLPIANAGMDQSLCKGETSQIGAIAHVGDTYQWQPISGLDDPAKSNPTATPTATTKYILIVTSSAGCIAIDSVMVTVSDFKATVSADTSVCAGSSVQLLASGGNNFKWSPIEGLDNPAIANPIASPDSSTKYKVVIFNGVCSDSTYVTVSIVPPPTANAGPDISTCIGETIQIGTSPQAGNTYDWQPRVGLNSPTISNPIANPNATTQYILTVTNSEGCISKDTAVITVSPLSERTFTLAPTSVTILPGKSFQMILNIPSDINTWKVHFDYDNLVIRFRSIDQLSSGITAITSELNRQLSLNGTGGNGTVLMTFNSFLPYNYDTTFAMKLIIDSISGQPCINVGSKGNIVELSEYCAKKIRMVSSTGNYYFLKSKTNGVSFGVGLQGKIHLELYDYIGTLKEILIDSDLEAGEYSLDFDLPTGIYFCHINAGMFNDVQKIIILEIH